MKYLKTKDTKKMTVSQLRRKVRQQIERVNTIEYELGKGNKAAYIKRIIEDIKGSGHVNVSQSSDMMLKTKVKYMRKKQLQTLYNELAGVINADRSTVEYARKLAERKKEMREKTSEAMGKDLSAEEYDTLLDLWDEYGEEMETYGYGEMADIVKSQGSDKSAKNIIDDIHAVEDLLESEDITPTKGRVLLYIQNRNEIEAILQEDPSLTILDAIERISTHT